MTVADGRIQLRNPDPKKKAPRIDRATYMIVRKVALATLPAKEPGMTWTDLRDTVSARLVRGSAGRRPIGGGG